MNKKHKLKKGFTIIELIVVIAVLGILVLLALPKFLGYTEKAQIVNIQSDIKSLETALNSNLSKDPDLFKGETPVSNDTIKGYQTNSTLYHIAKDNPVVSNQDGLGGVFYEVNSDLMKKVGFKSNLKGKFYYSENDNKVYFNRDKSNDSGVVDEGIPYAKDSDFTWVNDSDGYNVTSQATKGYYKYTGTSEVVRIPHKINGDSITSYYKMFYSNTLPSLTVISDNINVTNMNGMFSWSKSTSLDLSKLDTSNVTDMEKMFFYSQVKSLDLSKLNTSKVTNMKEMFRDSQATALNLSDFNTSSVKNMQGMFESSKATTLDLSSFNTSQVTTMQTMFYASKAMTLDVSNFDTSKVTNMSGMFSGSKSTVIDVSKLNTFNVKSMDGMFKGVKVAALDLSSFDTSNVTKMNNIYYDIIVGDDGGVSASGGGYGGLFEGSEIGTLTLGEKFTTSQVDSFSDMFNSAKIGSITGKTIDNFDVSNGTQFHATFFNLTLGGIEYPQLDLSKWRFNFDIIVKSEYMVPMNRFHNNMGSIITDTQETKNKIIELGKK